MLAIKKQLLKKQEIVQFIKDKTQKSSAIIFCNFSHAENGEIFLLKKKLKEVGGEWVVLKNTLFKKAFPNEKLEVKKNNAFIFCTGDQFSPLKTLKNFIFRNDLKNRIQGGLYDGQLVDSLTLNKWSTLKSKEASLNDFCNLLVFEMVKMTMLLEQIKTNRE